MEINFSSVFKLDEDKLIRSIHSKYTVCKFPYAVNLVIDGIEVSPSFLDEDNLVSEFLTEDSGQGYIENMDLKKHLITIRKLTRPAFVVFKFEDTITRFQRIYLKFNDALHFIRNNDPEFENPQVLFALRSNGMVDSFTKFSEKYHIVCHQVY